MPENVLVACIGNIFLGDDGFGFEVARALAARSLPPGVEVVDYGIRGLDMAYALLRPWRAAIIVDALAQTGAPQSLPPGTLRLLRPADVQAPAAQCPDGAKAVTPARVLATARSLAEVGAEIYILACQPELHPNHPEHRVGLSPAVAEAIPAAAGIILDLAGRLTAAGQVCAA